MKSPERVWLQHVLGLQLPTNSIFEDLPQLVGTAVHRSVKMILETNGTGSDLREGEDVPNRERELFWRRSVAMQAAGMAADLGRQALRLRGELIPLGELCEVPLAGMVNFDGATIPLHGRVDWLLHNTPGENSHVVDFKTGSVGVPLSPGGIRGGNFLQLALYGRILEAEGRACVLRILFPFARPKVLPLEKVSADGDGKMAAFWKFFAGLCGGLNLGYSGGREDGSGSAFLAYSHVRIPGEIFGARRRVSGFPGP
jgi:hypothetical protein